MRDTQQAYYLWLATQQAVLVLEATLELAQANLAANESLYRNGKITRDLVLRAEADLLEVEQQRIAAASRVRIAQGYVNLLRNAPLAAPLPRAEIDAAADRALPRAADPPPRRTGRSTRRCCSSSPPAAAPELRSLDAAIAGGEARQDLARAAFRPRLVLGAEAGIQGDDYGFSEDERYALASVILRWNLFRGGADRAALTRGARVHRGAARHARPRRAARAPRGAAGRREPRGRGRLARHRAEARRGGRRRAAHREPQARSRPDQPGGVHRRAARHDRRPAQPQPRARRIPRAHRRTRVRRRRPARDAARS